MIKIELNFLKIDEVDSIERELQIFFSKSSLEDWKKSAMQETQGKDPFDFLSWRGKDDILFLPYYDRQKDVDPQSFRPFQIPAAKNTAPRAWRNLPLVKVPNEKIAGALAHQHLLYGGDGVLFDVRNLSRPDLNVLIDNIEWSSCYTAFYTRSDQTLHDGLSEFIKNKFLPSEANGALFWESIPKRSNFSFYFEQCKNFHALGLLIHEKTPATEISEALIRGVEAFEYFSQAADPTDVLRSICFSIPAGQNFLECVAKFRALRMLWHQVVKSYGHKDYKIEDLHIHARSEAVPDGPLAPNQNMLKGTFAALAAILGGCNSLTVETESSASFVDRWARNVSSIMREESFLDKVADPLAGSWTLDAMTDSVAKKAWEMFQEKWRAYATT